MNLEPEIPEVLNKWPKYFNIKKKNFGDAHESV